MTSEIAQNSQATSLNVLHLVWPLGSIPNDSAFLRRVTVPFHLCANTIVVSTTSVDSFEPVIRLRCTRQAITLVRATAGLARMTWREGDKVGANVIINRAMLTPVVILFRCPLVSGIGE